MYPHYNSLVKYILVRSRKSKWPVQTNDDKSFPQDQCAHHNLPLPVTTPALTSLLVQVKNLLRMQNLGVENRREGLAN